MKIFLAGATGFVGQALITHLQERENQLTVLVRSPERVGSVPAGVETIIGDPTQSGPWQRAAAEAEAIINLTGATIFTRWSEAVKEQIRESRVRSTRNLVVALREAGNSPPRTLINASAVGYYGYADPEPKTEQAPAGHDFLAEICRVWEEEALAAQGLGHRVVLTRLGVVLGAGGGALSKMLPAFRLGLGGRMGNGRQGFPWIHLRDLLEIYSFLLSEPTIAGPVNCTAPQLLNNAQFTKALGAALHRPTVLPAPSWLLRPLLGEMSSMLLRGNQAPPALLTAHGFKFRFPEIDQALADLLA